MKDSAVVAIGVGRHEVARDDGAPAPQENVKDYNDCRSASRRVRFPRTSANRSYFLYLPPRNASSPAFLGVDLSSPSACAILHSNVGSSLEESSTCEQGSDQSDESREDRTREAQPELYPHLRGTCRPTFIGALDRIASPHSFPFACPQLQGRA
jgi:hypothetical protein